MVQLETLGSGDEAPLAAFLRPFTDSSMFLLSNLRTAGLADSGELFSGTWVAAVEASGIVAVAAHFWNGVLILQAPREVAPLARAAIARSSRRVAGLGGPWSQVEEALAALGLAEAPASLTHRAGLYVLDLAALRVPEPLLRGELSCRIVEPADLSFLLPWRVAYAIETLGQEDGPELRAGCLRELFDLESRRNAFVLLDLLDHGRPVAFTAFNARLPEAVQVGGVYTPPELRSRGYARAAVAGQLLLAREAGVARAVLFTELPAAAKAYRAIGFTPAGEWGLVLFR